MILKLYSSYLHTNRCSLKRLSNNIFLLINNSFTQNRYPLKENNNNNTFNYKLDMYVYNIDILLTFI